MHLTIKQARQIKNIIAIELLDVDKSNGVAMPTITKDPHAWEHADIPSRFSLQLIINAIRKI